MLGPTKRPEIYVGRVSVTVLSRTVFCMNDLCEFEINTLGLFDYRSRIRIHSESGFR